MKDGHSKKHLKYFGIVLSAAAIITVAATTLTWYAHNQKVEATTVKMKVVVSPNLVIADTVEGIVSRRIIDAKPFEVTYSGSTSRKLTPATHDLKSCPVNTVLGAAQTGLKCVTNLEAVNVDTGLAEPGKTLEYKTVPVYRDMDDRQYYYDYTVYVASTGTAWADRKLTASVSLADSGAADPYNACSVDFIVDGEYKGTANPVAAGESVVIYTGEIPHNEEVAGASYIPVTMRCYFDGELKKSGGSSAYINTTDVEGSISLINVNVLLRSVQ